MKAPKKTTHNAKGVIRKFGLIYENAEGRLVFDGFHCGDCSDYTRADVAIMSLVIARIQAELNRAVEVSTVCIFTAHNTTMAQAVQPT